jgi:hypothetical protein
MPNRRSTGDRCRGAAEHPVLGRHPWFYSFSPSASRELGAAN